MNESPGEQILKASCGQTRRGAWVCIPQQCNRDKGMCPERLVWELDINNNSKGTDHA